MGLQQELQQAIVELLHRANLLAVAEHRTRSAFQGAAHGVVLEALDAEIERLVPVAGEGLVGRPVLVERAARQAGAGGGEGDGAGAAEMEQEGVEFFEREAGWGFGPGRRHAFTPFGTGHGDSKVLGLSGGRTFRDNDRFSSIFLLNLQL